LITTVLTVTVWRSSTLRIPFDADADGDEVERRVRITSGYQAAIDYDYEHDMLTSDRFVARMNTLKFSRLDGSMIESDDLADLLAMKRGVAFVPKGAGIHPAIAAALHPDTIVCHPCQLSY
jgi:hypothetical protein